MPADPPSEDPPPLVATMASLVVLVLEVLEVLARVAVLEVLEFLLLVHKFGPGTPQHPPVRNWDRSRRWRCRRALAPPCAPCLPCACSGLWVAYCSSILSCC